MEKSFAICAGFDFHQVGGTSPPSAFPFCCSFPFAVHAIFSHALSASLPVLAATLSLVTYTLTTHDFDTGVVFATLSLFQVRICDPRRPSYYCLHIFLRCQLLRQPTLYFSRALAVIPDASTAMQRLSHILHAELRQDGIPVIDTTQEYAIDVRDATFEWESSDIADEQTSYSGTSKGDRYGPSLRKTKESDHAKSPQSDVCGNGPAFRVSNVTLTVPRGQLAAIVGPVGTGKVCLLPSHFLVDDDLSLSGLYTQSSLLQGIIGEMRKVSGGVTLSGRVAYCSQMAWIQNATLVSTHTSLTSSKT